MLLVIHNRVSTILKGLMYKHKTVTLKRILEKRAVGLGGGWNCLMIISKGELQYWW
jgi:hypothetical protein